jgi:microcystin-dependent protein
MSDQFVGEIRMFAGNFAPTGWAFCNGQILPISQNTALFSLLGTTYGGDGRSTFALPDLQGRTPLQAGQGAGLTLRNLGETAGAANVTLTADQIPSHSHSVPVSSADATGTALAGNSLGAITGKQTGSRIFNTYGPAQDMTAMGDSVGGSQPHNNRQPYLAVSFIIALQGIFPPRA